MNQARTGLRQGSWALVAALVCAGSAFAADFVWSPISGNNNSTTAGAWTNSAPPTSPGTYVDNFIITNNTTLANSATLNASYNIANLIATNTGTTARLIWIHNGLTLAVNGTSIVGSNTVLNVGTSTGGGSTFSNNNLFLQDNGQIILISGGPTAAGTLTVGGLFSNTTQSVIAATGATFLQFTSALITNAGTMAFVMGANGTTGQQLLTLQVGANSNAFFINTGNLLMGLQNTSISGPRVFAISNQFVNTGFFAITNANPNAATLITSAPNVFFTGASGGASTNTGTIRLVGDTTAIRQIAGTLTFSQGDFVNLGTLTWKQATNVTAALNLSEAGSIFSNAAGGQVITEAGGTGTFAIRADQNINRGTNLLNAGTLLYQTAAAAAGFLENSGTILYNGGFLNAGTVTNTVSGVISNSQAAGGTMVWTSGNTLQNFGTLHSGADVLTNSGAIFMNEGATFTGSLTNTATGSLIFSNGTATFDGTLANAGRVVAGAGYTNTITGFVWNSGTILVTNAATVLSLTNGGFNAGSISMRNDSAVLNIGGTNAATANLSGLTFTNASGATMKFGPPSGSGSLQGGIVNANTNGVGIYNLGVINAFAANGNGVNVTLNAAVINGSNATLQISGNGSTGVGYTISSLATNYGSISLLGNNAVTFTIQNGDFVNQGDISVGGSNPNLAFNVSGGQFINYSNVTLIAGSTSKSVTTLSGILNQAGGTFTLTSAQINFGAANAFTWKFSAITNYGTFVLNRTANATGTDPMALFQPIGFYNRGTVDVLAAANTLLSGTVLLTYVGSAGNALTALTNDSGGLIHVDNGAVFSVGLRNLGTLRVESNAVFTPSYAFRGAGNMILGSGATLANDGTVDLQGGFLAAATLSNAAGSTLQGFGEIGTVTITNIAAVPNLILTAGDIVNAGTISTTFLNAGNITNLSGGWIIGNGVIQSLNSTNTATSTNTFAANGRIFNTANAKVFASGGTLVLSNGFSLQAGSIGATNGTGGILQLGDGSLSFSNTGTVFLNNGGVLASGTITNLGTIQTTSGVGTNTGAVLNQAGGTVMASGGTLVLSNGFLAGSDNAGTLIISNSGTVRVGAGTPRGFSNTGTNNFHNGTLIAGTITNASTGLIRLTGTGSGIITGGTQVVNFGTISLANGQTLTFAGTTLTNTSAGSLAVTNGSTLRFNEASFYNQQTAASQFALDSGSLFFTNSGLFELTASSTFGGGGFSATNNNFFVGNLTLAGGQLKLVPLSAGNAFYVDTLTLASGTTLDLNGMNLYYATSASLLGSYINGSIIQLTDVLGKSFVQSGGTPWDWNDGVNWTTGTNPLIADDVFITNATAATTIYNTNAFTQVQSMVLSNGNSALTTLLVSNGTFYVSASTVIGSNGLLQVGADQAAGTSSNQNFTLRNGGQVALHNNTASDLSELSVTGIFSNAAGSTLSFNSTGGGTNQFTLATGAFTNAGTVVSLGGNNFVRAALALNNGTNSLQGGVLTYLDTADNPGLLINNGSLQFAGGSLVVGTLTNTATGVISGIFTNSAANTLTFVNLGGTLVNSLVNSGTLIPGSSGDITGGINNLATGTIEATNGTMRVGGGIANAGLVNIGSGATGVTLSNGNFRQIGTGAVLFNGAAAAATPNTLLVAGNFTNTSASVMTNAAGGAVNLKFVGNGVVTNAGTLTILAGTGVNGDQMFTVAVGSSSNNFFVNSGTLTLGTYRPSGNIGNRQFVISNQLVNTGALILSNAVDGGTGGGQVDVRFTGADGGASTNAGLIRFVQPGPSVASAFAGSLTFQNGDFVNAGTLSFSQVTNSTSFFTLAQAGSVFSNAAKGQVITEAGGTGTFMIRADASVNAGTNLLNAGTLAYRNRTGGAGTLQNTGTLLFNDGFLDVAALTNTITGVLTNQGSTFVWSAGSTNYNFGKIHTGTGVLTNNGVIVLNNGSTLVGRFTNATTGVWVVTNGTTTLTGGVDNRGTITMFDGILAGGAITNQSGGNITAFGGSTNRITSFVQNFGNVIVSNADSVLSFTNGAYNTGAIVVRPSAVLNIGGTDQASANESFSTFTNSSSGVITLGQQAFLGQPGGTLNASTNGIGIYNQGTLTTAGGPHSGNSVINAAVINAVGGTVKTTAGTESLTIYSMLTNFGSVIVPTVNESISVSQGDVFNAGIMTVAGGNISVAGTVVNSGTITLSGIRPALFTPLLFNQTNGYVTLTQNFGSTAAQMPSLGLAITNAGVIIINRQAAQAVGGNYTPDLGYTGNNPSYIPNIDNTGTLISSGNGALINAAVVLSSMGGTITNAPTGFIIASNKVVTAWTGLAKNQGTIQVETDSVFSVTYNTRGPTAGSGNPGNWDVGTGGFANDGTVNLKSGYLAATVFSNAVGSTLLGNGSIGRVTFSNNWDLAGAFGFVVTPGFVVNLGTISVGGTLNAGNITNLNGGNIIGNGTIQSLMSTNLNNGTNSFNFGGRLVNLAGGTVLASGGMLVLSNGLGVQQGTIGATNTAVLQLGDGTLALTNNGTIDLIGGELRSGDLLNNSNTVLRTGNTTLTIAGAFINPTTGNLLATNTTATISSIVSNQGFLEIRNSTVRVGGLTGDGTVTNVTGTLVFNNSGTANYAGTLRGLSFQLVMNGTGTQTLSGVATYTGGAVVSNGTLRLAGNDRLSGVGSITSAGGTLDLGGNGQTTTGLIAFHGGTVANGFLTNNGSSYDGRSGTVSATLAGIAGLSKTTGGTLTLNGANTYAGPTVVSSGVLLLGNDDALPNGGAVTVSSSGVLNAGGFSVTPGRVTLAGGLITNGTVTASQDYIVQSGTSAAELAGNVALYKTTSGTGVLSGPGTYTGGTFISNGTLRVNNTLAGDVQVYNSGKLGGNGTIAGLVTVHSGGTLSPGNSVGTNTVGSLTLLTGSVLDWEFQVTPPFISDYTIVTNNNGLSIQNGVGFNLLQENNPNPAVHFDAPGLYRLMEYYGGLGGAGVVGLSVLNPTDGRSYQFGSSASGVTNFLTLLISGLVGWDGGSATDNYWTNAENWGNDIAPTANDRLMFTGFNRLVNTNNFAANTPFAGMVFTNTGGSFVLEGNAMNLVGSIVNLSANTAHINLPLVLAGNDAVFITQNGNLAVGGDISESGGSYGLVKSGQRTLTLSGNSTYSGTTYVNAGTLLVNGTLGAGADILVASGASFGGTGIVSRALTLAGGATLTPGAPGVGLLTINDTLTLGNNFIYRWDLGATNSDLVVASVVDFAGTDWTLSLGAPNRSVAVNDVFLLMEWTTGINTAALTNQITFLDGGKWRATDAYVFIQGNQLLLSGVHVIPEPQVLMFWLCGGVVLLAARRRHRRLLGRSNG